MLGLLCFFFNSSFFFINYLFVLILDLQNGCKNSTPPSHYYNISGNVNILCGHSRMIKTGNIIN